jgi:predicted DNA-binding transcriptional regulator AlpA
MDVKTSGNEAVNEKRAASILNVSTKTLQAWRFQRRGPSYIKLGRAVRYLLSDLDLFLQNNKVAM